MEVWSRRKPEWEESLHVPSYVVLMIFPLKTYDIAIGVENVAESVFDIPF